VKTRYSQSPERGAAPGPNGDVAIYAAECENSRAVAYLRQAAGADAPDAVFIGADPAFDTLHSEPEFQALLKQLGLPLSAVPKSNDR